MIKNKREKARNKRLREEARKYILPVLLDLFKNKCYWCGEPIELRRVVDENHVIEEKHGVISYYKNGIPHIVRLASVDHVKPLSDGGNNKRNNLVPSCWFCNNDRSNSAI